MAVVAGPTQWWYNSDQYYACFAKCNTVGSTTYDGSRLICKAGGVGWFVAPSSTEVSEQWAGGQYNSTQVGNKCCISEWSALETALENRSRPIDSTKWFVPSGGAGGQLNNPGYVCRTQWDSFVATSYWSSTEGNATLACNQTFTNGSLGIFSKTFSNRVRAFRCVTY
jgi:hypothetical protein